MTSDSSAGSAREGPAHSSRFQAKGFPQLGQKVLPGIIAAPQAWQNTRAPGGG